MQTTGAEIMVRCLEEQKVHTVFGYPGGAILPFYEALRTSKKIKHILTVHEQGAVHAADGYARATGNVGVCIATSGPGATNLVTGLANAFLDSIPVVAITGQVASFMIGRDAFQEVDITGITMPITKHNFLVKNIENLANVIHMAFEIAASGRPGPVLVDVARDVQVASIPYKKIFRAPIKSVLAEDDAILHSAKILSNAKQPLILVGGGARSANAQKSVTNFAKKFKLPVVSTLMGLGTIDSNSNLFLGMTGLHGHERANNAVHDADVIIAVASRFNDRVTGDRHAYTKDKAIIHLDIDPAEIDKNITAEIGLLGDINHTLKTLAEKTTVSDLTEWWKQIKKSPSIAESTASTTNQFYIQTISDIVQDKDVIVATDVGQHQMWTAQHLKVQKSENWITSGGLGTMGFGLPAAMGASFARPNSTVISISGDGGFKMTGQELFTIAGHKLPIISIVMNNSGLGMIRQLQNVLFEGNFMACEYPNCIDFVKFANAFGIEGVRVDTPEKLKQELIQALAERKPKLIEIIIDPTDMVLPMVKIGLDINDYVKF